MKSIRTLFNALMLVLAVSACQNADLNGNSLFAGKEKGGLSTLTVKIANNATRLAFEKSGNVLKRQFAVDDELIGCTKVDDTYKNFTYKVQSVEANGAETILTLVKTEGDENVPSRTEGTILHFIYAPGHESSAISAEGVLNLNIEKQADGNIPAVMTADGTVSSDGTVTLSFTNIAAVVEIDPSQYTLDAVGANPYTFSSVCVAGGVTTGTLTVSDSGIEFVPGDAAGQVTVSPAEGKTEWNKDSKVYAALLPSTGSDIDVSLNVAFDNAVGNFYAAPIHSDVAANGYYSVAGAKNLELKAVAQSVVNGTTYYHATMADAAAFASAAESDVTITMIKDAVLEKYVTFKNDNSAVVTLDLNDCRISCDDTESSRTIYATSGELVIKDSGNNGTISGANSAVTANKAKLTIDGGNFVGGGYTSGGSGVVYSYGEGSKLTINGGTITCTETGNAGRAVNVTIDCEINGGTINCEEPTGYAFRTYGTCETIIDGENVFIYSVGSNGALYSGATNATGIFRNGYIYGGPDTHIISNSARFAVQGGHFNKSVTVPEGYQCIEDAVTGPDGRSYTHAVVEYVPANNVASVNGVEYAYLSDAIEAAAAFDGAADYVTLKMLDDANITSALNLTNNNGKAFYLDINGKNITVDVDSCFSSAGTLKVTDSGSTKGKITTSKARLFVKNTFSKNLGGELYIDGVTIESTYSASSTGTGSSNSVISLYGKSGNSPKLYLLNGTVINKMAPGKALYVRYANMEMVDSEINCTCSEGESSGWCIYEYATGTTNITNSSLYSQNNNCIRSGSQYPTININAGSYFYSGDGMSTLDTNAKASYGKFNLKKGSFFNDNPSTVVGVVSIDGSVVSTTETKYGRTYSFTIE